MNVLYTRSFQKDYDRLPPASKAQFKLVDAQLKAGNLDVLRRNTLIHYIGLGRGFVAWGKPMDGDDFLWIAIEGGGGPPMIL